MIDRIASHSNATIKRIRSLRDKKFRRLEGRFLAEGLRILTEALEAGVVPEILVFAEGAHSHPLVEALIGTVEASGGQVIETSRDILHKITEKDNPQAVVGCIVPNCRAALNARVLYRYNQDCRHPGRWRDPRDP